jgi:hypothetical protein
VRVAAAVCAGTALGPALVSTPVEPGLAGALVLCAALAALLSAPRATTGRARALAWSWLACVAAGAALRAAAAAPLPAPGADSPPWSGTWRPDPARADGSLGELEPQVALRPRLAVEAGTLRAGERVLVLSGGAPQRRARGPVAESTAWPSLWTGAAEPAELSLLLPDEVVRLAPAERGPLGALRGPTRARRASSPRSCSGTQGSSRRRRPTSSCARGRCTCSRSAGSTS